MTDDEFWGILGRDEAGKKFLKAVRIDLTSRRESDIRDFGKLLAAMVGTLFTRRHLEALTGSPDAPLTDYVECVCAAVVGAGRSTYLGVLHHPDQIGDYADDDEFGADLLELPQRSFEKISDEPYDDLSGRPQVNLNVVGAISPPDMPVWRIAVGAYTDWIWGVGKGRAAKSRTAEWQRWWALSGRQILDVNLEVEGYGWLPGIKFKTGRNRCEVWYVRRCQDLTAEEQVHAAVQDVAYALEQVRANFQMPAPPPMPTAVLSWKRQVKPVVTLKS